ncbi:hypothetical protein GTH32_16365 [Alteromonas sp. 345S023]|uniref:Uncharacterized protein n=1 Tax=Alteromonas profundi TaxID=2696062 RepID=A0A7X5LNQ1_9ALTE|nr:hypothetical protein [Alteromonas profundi]NDV92750.1 hypothetical protein [Alteromonas profundi]
MQNKEPQIGIFWLYNSRVIAKSTPLEALSPDSLSLYDCAYSHYIEWEKNAIFLPLYPELIGSEYQEYSRGRIVYCATTAIFKIYADKHFIDSAASQRLVRDRFSLNGRNCSWHVDSHYQRFQCAPLS